MSRLTLTKVFEKLFSLISVDIVYILLLLIFVLLALYFMFSNKLNKKEKNIIKTFYLIFIGVVIVNYYSSVLSFLDYMMNKIFLVIYFPNLAAYVIMVIVASIIFISSLFSKKINKVVRNVNIGIYILIAYLLVLLAKVVSDSKINVYSDIAIYKNEEMMVLVEVTMIIFSIWMLGLAIYKIVKSIKNTKNKDKVKEEFKKVSNKVNEEILIDGFTLEEYKLLSNYLKEIKKSDNK